MYIMLITKTYDADITKHSLRCGFVAISDIAYIEMYKISVFCGENTFCFLDRKTSEQGKLIRNSPWCLTGTACK